MKNPSPFTIYDASAGSGKTYTLVRKYLSLLFSSPRNDNYKKILAITFTNKAVAEMKTRIVEGLQGLSKEQRSAKEENLMQDLVKETNLTSGEISSRSREILKNILHNYAAFEVSTIDGFTHKVLRTFAKDLDLPLNFEVELRTEDILAEAVDQLIAKAGKDKVLTRVLVNFVLSKTDDDKSWDIARDLFLRAKLLTQETSQPFLVLLRNKDLEEFEVLAKEIKAQQLTLEKRIVEVADEFFDLLQENGLEDKDFTRGSCPYFFQKLQQGNFPSDFTARWQTGLAENPLYSKQLDIGKKEILDRIQPQIVLKFEEAKRALTRLQLLDSINKNLVPLSLLSAIQQEVDSIKQERLVVLISEFNPTIGKAVKDQPAPFIYERLGERYDHFFVDEFQDTSQLQWENLIPLVDHTLSSSGPSEENGSLTLVGDAKQSIYRWRGGKAEQFMELCQNKNPFSLQQKEIVVLPKNYRSARTIVNFNNAFFKQASSCFLKEEHRDLFLRSSQEVVSGKEGYVNISFVEAENAEEEMEAYPKRVLEIIEELSRRNFSKSSICILTRKRKESVAVANYLSDKGISVISAESLLLSRSPEVGFVNNILQFCLDPGDKNLKFEILGHLQEVLQPPDPYQFMEQGLSPEGQQFFDYLKNYGYDYNVEEASKLSVYENVEYIIRAFSLVKASDAYLQFFLDFVYDSSGSEGVGIVEYLELWERKKEELSIVVPQGEDAVQIMTIHKAKGLEFPVVIYPFANSAINDTAREEFWMKLPSGFNSAVQVAYLKAAEKMKDWEGEAPQLYEELCANSQLDALNVLYVAMTRPEQQLYVISKLDLKKTGEENMNRFSGLLISYLRSIGKWNDGLEYEFGDPNELPEEAKQQNESVQQETFFSSPTQSDKISLITRSGSLWDTRQKEAIEKGQLIHDLFAQIDTEADIPYVLNKAKEDGLFMEEAEEEIKNAIYEVVRHPALKDLFSEGIQNINERDIISGKAEILRPDRLVLKGKRLNIIDYKTGAENIQHKDQIDQYARVLEGMGYEVEKKLLVYINEGISIRVV